MPDTHVNAPSGQRGAVLDAAHLGDISGALGTIYENDTRPRLTWSAKLRTLAAIVGPGLIVMVGDNDAGAFATYTQAGQNYGTSLLWTLMLLVPVLYVNQEMVLRLGAVAGVGHARLILERFGKFWGAFSVVDLFVLNGLTIVTEFIGVSFGLDFLGLPKLWGVLAAAGVTMLAATTGNFRRFERFSLLLCLGSLLLVPVVLMVHPPLGEIARDLVIPRLPVSDRLSDVLLLIIAIVGTTVAPWQLFFQQSYVIDKHITPRFMAYEKVDLAIGIVFVLVGAVAMMAFCAATFVGHPEAGSFTDAGGVMAGLARYVGQVPATLFAIALIDASIIGASAVSLATAYALGDVLSLKHSLHRGARDAQGFYLVYCGLIAAAAGLVAGAGRPARADHGSGADAGGRSAAVGDRVPAIAVQRPGGARALGERAFDQPVHRLGDCAADHAVHRAHRLGALSFDYRCADPVGAGWRHGAGPGRGWSDAGVAHECGGAGAGLGTSSHLADASARPDVAREADGCNASVDDRAARLPACGRWAGRGPCHPAGAWAVGWTMQASVTATLLLMKEFAARALAPGASVGVFKPDRSGRESA